jgi:hypothetical protein
MGKGYATFKLGERLVQHPFLLHGCSQVQVRRNEIWIELQDFLKLANGLVEPAAEM